jgi:DNA-binding XRE family transcriptional regulator
MKNKKDNFHEELRAQLLQNPEFVEEYENFSLKLKLAEELKSARAKSKMTLEDVAKKMKTSATALSRLESAQGKANPTLGTIDSYLHAVNCHIEFRVVSNKKKTKPARWISGAI